MIKTLHRYQGQYSRIFIRNFRLLIWFSKFYKDCYWSWNNKKSSRRGKEKFSLCFSFPRSVLVKASFKTWLRTATHTSFSRGSLSCLFRYNDSVKELQFQTPLCGPNTSWIYICTCIIQENLFLQYTCILYLITCRGCRQNDPDFFWWISIYFRL